MFKNFKATITNKPIFRGNFNTNNDFKKVTEGCSYLNINDHKILKASKSQYSEINVDCAFRDSGLESVRGKISAKPIHSGRINGMPAIWEILSNLNISSGKGSSLKKYHVHDYEYGTLTICSYKQINGEWYYAIHQDVIKIIANKYNI